MYFLEPAYDAMPVAAVAVLPMLFESLHENPFEINIDLTNIGKNFEELCKKSWELFPGMNSPC